MIKNYAANEDFPRSPGGALRIMTRSELIAEETSDSGKCSLIEDLDQHKVVYSHRFDIVFGMNEVTPTRLNLLPSNDFYRLIREKSLLTMETRLRTIDYAYLGDTTLEMSYPINIIFPNFWGIDQLVVVHQTSKFFLLRHDDHSLNSLAVIHGYEIIGGTPPNAYYHMTPVIKKRGMIDGETKTMVLEASSQISIALPFTEREWDIFVEFSNGSTTKVVCQELKLSQDGLKWHLRNMRRKIDTLGLKLSCSELAQNLHALRIC